MMTFYEEAYKKHYGIFHDIWAPYVEKNRQHIRVVKLTAYHTREAARYADEAGVYAELAADHVNDFLIEEAINEGDLLLTSI